jgi:hypothetical protein
MERLKYRRQFLFLNKVINIFDGWGQLAIINQQKSYYLYYHPDLFIYQGANDHFELFLLGYILDPDNPEYDNNVILNDLLKNTSYEGIISSIHKYAGRFVLIFSSENDFKVLNDATGFREVFYTFVDFTICLGSTPNIISEFVEVRKTRDKDILDFHQSPEYRRDHTWVGCNTLYDGVLHLVPNHYLDLQLRKTFRFWPVKQQDMVSLEYCATESARILKGTIASAVNRYTLHIGLTSGWDSRLILSATKDHKDSIYYYVNKLANFNSNSPDLVIPLKISKKFGFNLNIIETLQEVDPQFKKIFYGNNILAHDKLLPIFYEVYRRKWEDTYTVSGTMGNGLARIYLRLPKNVEITGENIARIVGFQKFPYAVSSLEKWAADVRVLCKETRIDIMDLFEWEQDDANWASLTSSEQDIVREELRPFNNRKLIEMFWSLDPKYRFQYNPAIYKAIIKILWEDVLHFPFNPSRRTSFYSLLRSFGIERKVYHVYKKRKFFNTN